MIGSSRSYAIGTAHFQIAGGWKSLLTICATYIAVVCIVLSYLYYDAAAPGAMRRGGGGGGGPVITTAAVVAVTALETVVLLFFGNFRIMGIIRMDATNRMIESHRLMPIPSWRAVTGYMLGGTAHAIGFALLNVLLAYIFAANSRTSLAQVTMSQAVLAMFVLFVWSAATLGSLRGKAFGGLFAMCISGGFIGGIYIYGLLPGVALLVSPVMGATVFSFVPGAPSLQFAYPFSFIAQAIFFAIFFSGACRLYRGTHPTTFNIWEAMALSAAWSATTIAGLYMWPRFHTTRLFVREVRSIKPSAQVIASIILAMLIVAIPLRTLMIAELRWKHKAAARLAVLAAMIVTIALIPLGILNLPEATLRHFAITALIVASHVICVYLLFKIMRRAKPMQAFTAVAVPGLLLWFGPLAVELIQMLMLPPDAYGNRPDGSGFASSFSPAGLLVETWTPGQHVSPVPGLVFQCALPVLLGLLMLKKRAKQKAAAETIVPATYDSLNPKNSPPRE